MVISYKPNTIYGVPSTSFPTTSHPTTYRIEKKLHNIKKWLLSSSSSSSNKVSTDSICDSLSKLSQLYDCMHELINSLSSIQNEQWVEELMDGLIRFLDVCGIMRDIVLQIKGHVTVLQCALRRRKGASTLESSIRRYNSFRKRSKKDVKRWISRLKKSVAAKSEDYNHTHHHHEVVIEMVKEVREVTVTIFVSVLNLLVMEAPRTPKDNVLCMVVSKLIRKTRVTCEEHRHQQWRTTCDYEGLDAVPLNRCIKDGLLSWAYGKCRLERMEDQVKRIEDGLESISTRLIRTRASLLNIVSHY